LTVKLISARGLAVEQSSTSGGARPEPYVVVQFEQNEFVSRPALAGNEPEPQQQQSTTQSNSAASSLGTKTSIPRTNSYGPSLGIASISRAFADAAVLASGQTTPRATGSVAPMSPGLGGSGFFGSKSSGSSAGDPVWKEDVSLYVYTWGLIVIRSDAG
jgi:hypothetical protein